MTSLFFFFYLPNPYSRTVAQPDSTSNWNYYQKSFLGIKRGRCVKLTTSSPSGSRRSEGTYHLLTRIWEETSKKQSFTNIFGTRGECLSSLLCHNHEEMWICVFLLGNSSFTNENLGRLIRNINKNHAKKQKQTDPKPKLLPINSKETRNGPAVLLPLHVRALTLLELKYWRHTIWKLLLSHQFPVLLKICVGTHEFYLIAFSRDLWTLFCEAARS
jgi:hypothetical protein